jgi:hypothetical protein
MNSFRSILLIVSLTTAMCITESKQANAQVSVSFQVFYDQLSPYGSWVSYPEYGYVWVPRGHHHFQPYFSGGHWVFTDGGWFWMSDYEWGWAPFHYGSWVYDSYYGWAWVPGYNWAPAWVTWGSYNDYYGWAPMGPSWTVSYRPPINEWYFVHPQYLASPDWHNHYYGPRANRISLGGNVAIVDAQKINIVRGDNGPGGTTFYGPRKADVERIGKTQLRPVAIKNTDKPGRESIRDNSIQIYRPQVSKENHSAKPSRIATREEVKKDQERNVRNEPAKVNDRNKPAQRPDAGSPSNTPQRQTVPARKPEIRNETPQKRDVQTKPEMRNETPQKRDMQTKPEMRNETPQKRDMQTKPEMRNEMPAKRDIQPRNDNRQPADVRPAPAQPRANPTPPRSITPAQPHSIPQRPQPAPSKIPEHGRR